MQPSEDKESDRKTKIDNYFAAIEKKARTALTTKLSSSLPLRRHNATACTQSDTSSSSSRSLIATAVSTSAEASTTNIEIKSLFSSPIIAANKCYTEKKDEELEKTQRSKLNNQRVYSLYETFLMINDKTGKSTEYMLDGKLGIGGFSSVFLVHNVENDQQYAMKVVRIDTDLELRPQFLFEIEVLKRFSGSDHIIDLHNYKVTDSELLLILELGTEAFIDHLCRYQRRRTDIEHSFLRKNFVQMVRAVQFVHQHDILHCDIKGDNFVFTNGERLKLIDFGCATPLGILNQGVIRKRRLGTKHYMPPEYMRDNYATKSLDIWSLGCILYDMIHERTPFESETNIRQAVIDRKPDLSHVSCHSELMILFTNMFEQDYKQRITCQEILCNNYIRRHTDNPPTIPMPRCASKLVNDKVNEKSH